MDNSAAHYKNLERQLTTLGPQWREKAERTNHNIKWALGYWKEYLEKRKFPDPDSRPKYRKLLERFNGAQCATFLQ